jgi:hypothetical protein
VEIYLTKTHAAIIRVGLVFFKDRRKHPATAFIIIVA